MRKMELVFFEPVSALECKGGARGGGRDWCGCGERKFFLKKKKEGEGPQQNLIKNKKVQGKKVRQDWGKKKKFSLIFPSIVK